jgi:hypothetical protein
MTRSRIINVMNGAKLKYDSRFMELYLEDYNGNNLIRMGKYDLIYDAASHSFTLMNYYYDSHRKITGEYLMRYKWNKKHDELKAKHDGIDLLMKKI